MRSRRGVLMSSEKSSANTLTGREGRAVPAATRHGWVGRFGHGTRTTTRASAGR